MKIGTTTLSKPFDIAEAFSNYFLNIAPHFNNQLPNSNINPNSYLEGHFPQSMVVPILTTQDLRNVIKKKLNSKTSGVNDIAVTVIERNTDLFTILLTFLFHFSVAT